MAFTPRYSEASVDEAMELTSDYQTDVDIEQKATVDAHLQNTTVQNYLWKDITVTVKDRETKKPLRILENVTGVVEAGKSSYLFIAWDLIDYLGELCALMGPSGCGKTTLLNVLARRDVAADKVEGVHLVNGTDPSLASFQKLSSYVEQDDALIGSLTVRETMIFAARLSHTE